MFREWARSEEQELAGRERDLVAAIQKAKEREAKLDRAEGDAEIQARDLNASPAAQAPVVARARQLHAERQAARDEWLRLEGDLADVRSQVRRAQDRRLVRELLGGDVPVVTVPDPVAADAEARGLRERENKLQAEIERLEGAERELQPKLAEITGVLRDKRVAVTLGEAKAGDVTALERQAATVSAELEKVREQRGDVTRARAVIVSKREAREELLRGRQAGAIAAAYRQTVLERALPAMRAAALATEELATLYRAGCIGGGAGTAEWPAPIRDLLVSDAYSKMRAWLTAARRMAQ